MTYKILKPKEFSGDAGGDWGYEIDGIKSEDGYKNYTSAEKAMIRKMVKIEKSK